MILTFIQQDQLSQAHPCPTAAWLIEFSTGKLVQNWSNNHFSVLGGQAKTNSSTDQQSQLRLVALHCSGIGGIGSGSFSN